MYSLCFTNNLDLVTLKSIPITEVSTVIKITVNIKMSDNCSCCMV